MSKFNWFLFSWLIFLGCLPEPPDYTNINYLIVVSSRNEYLLDNFIELKTKQKFNVTVQTIEYIIENVNGDNNQDKLRNYIKEFSEQKPDKEYVLLIGHRDVIPMLKAYPDPFTDKWYLSKYIYTDYYYEELNCDFNKDEDSFPGEWKDDINKDNCDFEQETYVGRIPWNEPEYIENNLNAIIEYQTSDNINFKTGLGAAAIISFPCDSASYLKQADLTYMKNAGYDTTTLFERCGILLPDGKLTDTSFIKNWEEIQPSFVAWFSHGTPTGSYLKSGLSFISKYDQLPENTKPVIAFTSACMVASPTTSSLGRLLSAYGITAGFIGSGGITNTGSSLFPAYKSQYLIGKYLVLEQLSLGEGLYKSLKYYIDNTKIRNFNDGYIMNQNVFQMHIYGDPSLQIK